MAICCLLKFASWNHVNTHVSMWPNEMILKQKVEWTFCHENRTIPVIWEGCRLENFITIYIPKLTFHLDPLHLHICMIWICLILFNSQIGFRMKESFTLCCFGSVCLWVCCVEWQSWQCCWLMSLSDNDCCWQLAVGIGNQEIQWHWHWQGLTSWLMMMMMLSWT